MAVEHYVILGAGFTGSRVAKRLTNRGFRVSTTRRSELDLTRPGWQEQVACLVRPNCAVLHSVPTLPNGLDGQLAEQLSAAELIVYLSTTGVYGAQKYVDQHSEPAPRTERERARVATESAIQAVSPSSLIIRPAAIYGPGRGIHMSLLGNKARLVNGGTNYISRIHVDDLAALSEAALLTDLAGAYPAADEHPCTSREILEFCSQLLNAPMPKPESSYSDSSLATDRQVDGRTLCAALGVHLQYPSYKTGIPASLASHTPG